MISKSCNLGGLRALASFGVPLFVQPVYILNASSDGTTSLEIGRI